MNLPEKTKKAMYEAYRNLSEELLIFFRCLRNEGFSHKDAMSLLCAIVGRPDNMLGNYRHEKITKREAMERLRTHLAERKNKHDESAFPEETEKDDERP